MSLFLKPRMRLPYTNTYRLARSSSRAGPSFLTFKRELSILVASLSVNSCFLSCCISSHACSYFDLHSDSVVLRNFTSASCASDYENTKTLSFNISGWHALLSKYNVSLKNRLLILNLVISYWLPANNSIQRVNEIT